MPPKMQVFGGIFEFRSRLIKYVKKMFTEITDSLLENRPVKWYIYHSTEGEQMSEKKTNEILEEQRKARQEF